METKISPVRPIIYRFYGTSDWALEPNTYVYYRVMMVDSLKQEYVNYMILFQGKNFTMVDDNNQPYLDFDFTDILSDYMYKSGLSLEPEYSAYQDGGFAIQNLSLISIRQKRTFLHCLQSHLVMA